MITVDVWDSRKINDTGFLKFLRNKLSKMDLEWDFWNFLTLFIESRHFLSLSFQFLWNLTNN